MSSLFSKPKTPSNNTGDREYYYQVNKDAEAKAAADKTAAENERAAQAKSTGRASTIVAGLNDDADEAPSAKRQLLGQ